MSVTTGELIRQYRKREGITQSSLARSIGISRNYLSQIENDNATSVSFDVMERVRKVTGVSLGKVNAVSAVAIGVAKRQGLSDRDAEVVGGIRYRGRMIKSELEASVIVACLKSIIGTRN